MNTFKNYSGKTLEELCDQLNLGGEGGGDKYIFYVSLGIARTLAMLENITYISSCLAQKAKEQASNQP